MLPKFSTTSCAVRLGSEPPPWSTFAPNPMSCSFSWEGKQITYNKNCAIKCFSYTIYFIIWHFIFVKTIYFFKLWSRRFSKHSILCLLYIWVTFIKIILAFVDYLLFCIFDAVVFGTYYIMQHWNILYSYVDKSFSVVIYYFLSPLFYICLDCLSYVLLVCQVNWHHKVQISLYYTLHIYIYIGLSCRRN